MLHVYAEVAPRRSGVYALNSHISVLFEEEFMAFHNEARNLEPVIDVPSTSNRNNENDKFFFFNGKYDSKVAYP